MGVIWEGSRVRCQGLVEMVEPATREAHQNWLGSPGLVLPDTNTSARELLHFGRVHPQQPFGLLN